MANNSPAGARNAAPSGGNSSGGGRRIFFAILVLVAIIGVGALLYASKHPTATPTADADAQYKALQASYATAGPPQPYTAGNPKAPVTIEEFADFECPSCGRFATITEPDVRKNLIASGAVFYKYYDFPLPIHHNTQAASNAAACADEQGKFWEMHDQLFAGQEAWGLTSDESEATDNPKSVFLGYAKAIGLNTQQWESCFDSRKHQTRVNANAAEALKRNVSHTPTFYVNGQKAEGAIPYDELKRLVDNAPKAASNSK